MTITRKMTPPALDIELLPALHKCLVALDQKKAEDLKLLYVGDISSVTEFFLIATGTSNPHLRALSEAASGAIEDEGEQCESAGAGGQSGWVVVDAYDFIVHLFTVETRRYFNLEGLWKDGRSIDLSLIPGLMPPSPFSAIPRD